MKAFISPASLPLSYSPPMHFSFLFPPFKGDCGEDCNDDKGWGTICFWKVQNLMPVLLERSWKIGKTACCRKAALRRESGSAALVMYHAALPCCAVD
ncbi:hypothetical protein Q9966_009575 [Columba livia]|nr:hypothetical protein Q9966_009575 [Columba livia]